MPKRKFSSNFYKKVDAHTERLIEDSTFDWESSKNHDEDDQHYVAGISCCEVPEVLEHLDLQESDPDIIHLVNDVSEDKSTTVPSLHYSCTDNNLSVNESNAALNFQNGLRSWALRNSITHSAVGELLTLIKTVAVPEFITLPSDPRTFLSTPRNTIVRTVEPGLYSHIGVQKAVEKLCQNKSIDNVSLLCNVDGLPLSKSSGSQIYPILCTLHNDKEKVAVIGIYHGYEKPASANDFLKDFVDETIQLTNNGILIHGRIIPFSIKGFICDAPAKSFVSYTKGHTGFYSCTKCMQKGTYIKGRTCFPKTNCKKRTDLNFIRKSQPSHHTGTSVIENIPRLGMVTSFPLEYMHLLCLGVVKKLIVNLWLFGKAPNKLRLQIAQSISDLYLSFKDHVPVEFVRKPRSFDEVKRWKATEFRFFLFYSGPVVLKKFLPEEKYSNFLCLHVASTIFANFEYINKYHNFAEELLIYFVQNFGEIYGEEYISHNIHGLTHVPDDIKVFGCLDSYSAFCFENYLQSLKKLVRKSEHPLSQIMRRLTELENLSGNEIRISEILPLPEREHDKGPLPEGFTVQYERVKFKSFTLVVNRDGNNFCALRNGSIIKVLNFAKKNNGIFAIGKSFLKVDNFFRSRVNPQLSEYILFVTWDLNQYGL